MVNLQTYAVESASNRELEKRLQLTDSGGRPFSVRVHRYALVGKGDTLAIDPEHPRNVFVSDQETGGFIRVLPHYEAEAEVRLGDDRFSFRLSEPTTSEDFAGYQLLEQFHYKTLVSDGSENEGAKQASVGGRKAVLIASIKRGKTYTVVGYVELHMPLLMTKPRHDLFDLGFEHPERPIRWDQWDLPAMRKYVNALVRIARVVIHPEYRGLGLSRLCIEHAKTFARERWHIGGVRPIFMEISAEMLSHIDFVSHAGFHFVGNTEGNLNRVIKDIHHMSKGYDVSSGIMSLQKKYLTHLQDYCHSSGKPVADVLERLELITKHERPMDAMTTSEWLGLRKVLRFPIPYYLCGLDRYTSEFLNKHRPKTRDSAATKFSAPSAIVRLEDVRISLDYELPQTQSTRVILNCFGIQTTHLRSPLIGPVDIEASGGNIVFISGSSGTGKSVLLRALDPNLRGKETSLNVRSVGASNYSASWLRHLPEDIPIFELFAERFSPARAMSAMSQVGLSEAFVFVKPFRLLSRGQRYRAMLADLILRNDAVWLIDEFCADLDPLAAKVVAHNLRKNVLKSGRIAFVAAANHEHFIDALRPNRVIYLNLGGSAKFMSFKDYREELRLGLA
jgi:ABC-type transport system involved in cytochrome c biogenesis ATPase subunit/GNAT superfamily N-acetyltransferase